MRFCCLFSFICLSFAGLSQKCSTCEKLFLEKQFDQVIEQVIQLGDEAGIQDLVYLGKSFQSLGSSKEAIKVYERVLLLDEENVEACVAVGALFLDMKKYENALFATERALKFDPNNQLAIFNLAVIYMDQKNYGKLNEYLDQRLLENQNQVDFLYIKAMSLFDQENYEEANVYFEKIEKIKPEFQNFNFYYGYSLYKLRQFDAAKGKLKQSIKLQDEELIDAYYYLAQVNVQLNNKVDACEAYTKAINLGDITITKEADEYCQGKKVKKIKFRDRGVRVKF